MFSVHFVCEMIGLRTNALKLEKKYVRTLENTAISSNNLIGTVYRELDISCIFRTYIILYYKLLNMISKQFF